MEVNPIKALTCIDHGKFTLIEAGKTDTAPLITHRYKLEDIEEAYRFFENNPDRVIKVTAIP